MNRRNLCAAMAGMAILPWSVASAQSKFPSRPIRLVAPYPAGGTVDILARAIGVPLGKALGQSVVVDNRGGAGGTLGTDLVAHAPADGYTLLFGAVHQAIAQSVYSKLNYDFQRDLVPVSMLGRVNHVLIVNNGLTVRTVADLVAYLKANPGKLNYGTPGNGSLHHLLAEQFKAMTGTSMSHVPYRGAGQSMVDLIGGAIHVYFESMPSALQQIRSGTVRALAVTSKQRSIALPQIPTLAESGLDNYDASSWYGMFAPANTPKDVVQRLNEAINQVYASKEFVAQWREFGAEPGGGAPSELAALVDSEVPRWAAVAKAAKIRID